MSHFLKMDKIVSTSKVSTAVISGYHAMVYTDAGGKIMMFSSEEGIKIQASFAVNTYVDPGNPKRTRISAFYGDDFYVEACFYNEDLEANVKAVIATVRSLICQQR